MSEEQFEDAESYSSNFMKDKVTFRDLILQHLKRISQLASVEFHGGYWNDKMVSVGGGSTMVKIYVPDSREVYSNAVECFADMLFPYFDKEIIEQEEKCVTAIEESKEKSKDRITLSKAKRESNRILFRALCSFLFRKKYLELGSIED